MRFASFFSLGLLLVSVVSAGSPFIQPDHGIYRFNYENILGTSLELKIVAASEANAEKGQAAALAEIEREAKILSGYDSSSEFSRWMKTSGTPVRVSPEMREVLGLFDQWRERTGGALDASSETITRVWKKAASEKRTPSRVELAEAVAMVGQQHWKLDRAKGTATHLSNAPLMLNSFTKSYILNKAAEAATAAAGVFGVVVNGGGDLVVRGKFTERLNIADPRSDAENGTPIATLSIQNRAVATSGNYRRGFEIDGKHYSHIVDPRTGQPAQDVISSTVVAANASDAGALATAFSVMKPAESKKLAALMNSVEFLLVMADGEQLASAGWRALTVPGAALMAVDYAEDGWDSSMELSINVELARIEDMRARRPYLAAWIEDKDKTSIRTVALWVQKTRYIPDLRAWYKADRDRFGAGGSELAASVSSATRSPGSYTFKWDGKDDSGKPVKPGKYTVMIEAVREHGGYQLIHQEVDFNGSPKRIPLPGGAEIAAASLDYRKTAK